VLRLSGSHHLARVVDAEEPHQTFQLGHRRRGVEIAHLLRLDVMLVEDGEGRAARRTGRVDAELGVGGGGLHGGHIRALGPCADR
jgi:hypothetical protein